MPDVILLLLPIHLPPNFLNYNSLNILADCNNHVTLSFFLSSFFFVKLEDSLRGNGGRGLGYFLETGIF